MFKDKFNEEMQNIKVTAERKAKLLEGIKVEQERGSSVNFKKFIEKRWFAAVAAVLVMVIVSVTVLNLPIFVGQEDMTAETGSENSSEVDTDEEIKFPTIAHQKGIPARVSYSQIYQLFSAIYQTENKKYSYTNGTMEEEMVWEEDSNDVIADGEALPGGMGGDTGSVKGEENTTAKPTDDVEDFSTTNTQVEEVDEADIVKTDGKYIYILNKNACTVKIVSANKGKIKNLLTIFLSENDGVNQKYFYNAEMYLTSGRLVIVYEYYTNKSYTKAKIYDVSNPEKSVIVREVSQSGSYLSSRVIGDKLYMFTNEYIYEKPNENDKCSYVPCVSVDGDAPTPIDDSNIYMFDGEVNRSYLTAISVDTVTGNIIDSKTALGGGSQLYANTKSIYVTADRSSYSYAAEAGTPELLTKYEHATRIMRFAINSGKIAAVSEGVVAGSPLNQFSMDEYKNHFRIVTTRYDTYTTTNAVYILDENLKQVGAIENIAKDERVYSVRFMGDTGYFVTFRETDPLFAVDLKDPKNPKILSALKIPGFSNYLHPWDNGLLLGIGQEADEIGRIEGFKLSMFDVSNPENVSEKHKKAESYIDTSIGTQHKAVLISKEKNLIAFPVKDAKYYVYGYSAENGFEQKAVLDAQSIEGMYYYTDCTRGIYIGDFLYVCNYNGIISYSLNDFKEVDNIVF